MSRRTLACSVSASVYDQFRALLPEGVDVNGQLTNLVEHFIASTPSKVDMDALRARWHVEWLAEYRSREPVSPPEQPDTAPMAVYDPDRPLQEQIDELEPDAVMQFPEHTRVGYRVGVDAARGAWDSIRHSVSDAATARDTHELTVTADRSGGTSVISANRALAAAEQDAARAFLNADTCLHPHETLVRDGRFVRCTLCDRIIR